MKKIMKSLMALAVAFMGFSTAANADVLKRDTVYVIKDMGYPVPIGAYKVENDGNLTDVGTQNVNGQDQAVGIAVCTKNKRIFVSYESFNQNDGIVDVLDAETFQVLSQLTIPGTSNIAGMVFSENRRRLYVVDRNKAHVFVYSVDANANVVRVISEEFDAADGVWGIDVWGNKLYCTHGNNRVTVYDLSTGTEITAESYTTTSSHNHAIAVDGSDSNNTYVYTTWTNQWTTASILTQYNSMWHGNERRIDLGRDGRGLSVNPALGHVYAVVGDDYDTEAPELRTYGENQFMGIAPITPTPLYTDPLTQGRDATDVFAAGITFNPQATIEMIDPADKNLSLGKDVTFEITIKNPSSDSNMTIKEMEDTYITDDLSFISSSLPLPPDDTLDDGNISWSGLNITIAPDANYTFTKTFATLREVNCSIEAIQITKATYTKLDGGSVEDVEPFGNSILFDIGPSCGCDPKLDSIGGGCTYNPDSKSFDMMYIFMMLAILFGGLAMRRKKTF